MPTVVIVGASRGIGLEFAKQYGAEGWRVVATVRNVRDCERLQQLGSRVETAILDLLDHSTIKQFSTTLQSQPIDLLICNGAMYGPSSSQIGALDYSAWATAMRTNVMGHMAVVENLLANVEQSSRKLIIFMSSRYASIEWHAGDDYIYRSSKAALNSVARGLARELHPRAITVLPVSPGWVQTDMGGPGGNLTPEQSVTYLRALFERVSLEDTGRFLNYDGSEIPW